MGSELFNIGEVHKLDAKVTNNAALASALHPTRLQQKPCSAIILCYDGSSKLAE
ncbi:hypothetical protein GLW08_11135 [Pontibacillus yanchengensis]|uniref:Uncharacterized protein n=2 Tax=Pontibacillus yanchengensis TaxID=462910 RepID=A0ACC7VID8_9BACI|nr:hypothetical protein [Pontibacillus yanchengensis]MYL33864.1 hypothetical protein [Pontibacillus yanchengensis]MYL53890.1 hypothetical protein [Pontibacillus yanchengensis]